MCREARYFSLIEILVAMAILGMALAFLGRLAIQGSRISRNNQDLTQAALLAQEKMEEIFLLADSLPLAPGSQSSWGQGVWSSYQWKREISLPDPARPGLFELDISVSRSPDAASPLIRLHSALYQTQVQTMAQ